MNKPIIIGVSGFARSGKDTFVKIAKKIIESNGYVGHKLAFADELKNEIDSFLFKYYSISAWTDDSNEKAFIRPLLVAHGCQKRKQTEGKYWVDKIDKIIKEKFCQDLDNQVIFLSDCRFPNEMDWIHDKWGGWVVHLKKYTIEKYFNVLEENDDRPSGPQIKRIYDLAPNEEESINDPLCQKKSDYELELENITERNRRLWNIKITPESLVDDTYLNEEIRLCLLKCPLLHNIK